jgi:hypothetical protein
MGDNRNQGLADLFLKRRFSEKPAKVKCRIYRFCRNPIVAQ